MRLSPPSLIGQCFVHDVIGGCPALVPRFAPEQKHKPRESFSALPDDDRKLLCLYFFRCRTGEQIGAEFGVCKITISKLLRKLLGHLRSLMDETP